MILASATPVTLALALGASAAYAASATGAARVGQTLPRIAVWVAWCLHGMMLAWGLWGSEPRFGFAPALSVTTWLVGLVYAIEGYVFPQLKTPWLLSSAGSATVLLALLFPGQTLHASASTWLPLHWALGIASYGLFAVAVIHAWFMTRAEARIRVAANAVNGLPLLTMERLTFRFVSLGFILLSATLLAGFFFGSQLYGGGHAIKLDHKTIFSVLSWLTFAILVVGRARLGWRGKRAVRFLYAGSGLLLLAYVGSRFVMEIMLGQTL
ncbi:inner membrane protein YpjD [Rhodoferax sp.]|uniref:cytochrome C assembly family protein n=1 Tax=Rhodoferax sp. TaxID=50421 RepID=UPI0025D68CB0|nr:cytochrome c biogenesis protein CcsA [Rhodoferax sp.]MCM2297356.1 cytochrome c biogenesis protein CcsA [Rhodoferax sp.]MDD3937522.1 cytochrome c biogenesis protein CcsA [Rhodoferax sp.]